MNVGLPECIDTDWKTAPCYFSSKHKTLKSQIGKKISSCPTGNLNLNLKKKIGFGVRQIFASILVQLSTRYETLCWAANSYLSGSVCHYKIVVMTPIAIAMNF